jgi:hypothetical protein
VFPQGNLDYRTWIWRVSAITEEGRGRQEEEEDKPLQRKEEEDRRKRKTESREG